MVRRPVKHHHPEQLLCQSQRHLLISIDLAHRRAGSRKTRFFLVERTAGFGSDAVKIAAGEQILLESFPASDLRVTGNKWF